jgi:UDP-N-acetylmuramate dehydrogenase
VIRVANLLEELTRVLPPERVLVDEPMANHTTFRLGGPAELFALPETPEEAVHAFRVAAALGVPCLVLGNGSNMIVRDGGLRGLVVSMQRMNAVAVEGGTLTAQAGALLSKVASEALSAGLTGLEFACGIPGSAGGAAAMNAGAYGFDMACILTDARVWMDGKDQWLPREALDYGYRRSAILKKSGMVLEARYHLAPGDPEVIRKRMNDYNASRREKQPLTLPSAGSVFKRPEGHYAGALIEQAGLKGATIGGAQVSTLHAGFIVNVGGATAKDVTALIAHIQREVLEKFGVALECEVRILGEE